MYYESIIEESLETRAYRLPLTFLHYAAIFFRFLHFSLPPFTLDMFKRTYYYSDSFSVPRVLQFLCCIQQLNMYWPLRWQHLLHYVINLQCFTKIYVTYLFYGTAESNKAWKNTKANIMKFIDFLLYNYKNTFIIE